MFSALLKPFRRPAEPAPAAGGKATSASAAPPTTEHLDHAATAPAAVAYGMRRPFVGAGGEIAGFEFRLSEGIQRRLLERGDATANAAHVAALLTSMRLTAQAGRLAYTELPVDLLGAPKLPGLVAQGMVFGFADPVSQVQMQAGAAALHQAGARFGWAEQSPAGPLPDVRLVRLAEQASQALPAAVQRWRSHRPGAPLLAIGATTVDELEAALSSGATYVCGEMAMQAQAGPGTPFPPQVLRIHKLLQRLERDTDNRGLATDIKADVGLTYRLLRFANSAAVGTTRTIDSIEQALMVLGHKELQRWLNIMLISSADTRPTARALQEVALARARLLELLALERGDDRPEGFFTLGLASMLGVLLQMPLAKAIEPLQMVEPARQALLERSGPWHAHLDLAVLLEQHQAAAAESAATAFNGVQRALELAEQAWQWSAAATAELRR